MIVPAYILLLPWNDESSRATDWPAIEAAEARGGGSSSNTILRLLYSCAQRRSTQEATHARPMFSHKCRAANHVNHIHTSASMRLGSAHRSRLVQLNHRQRRCCHSVSAPRKPNGQAGKVVEVVANQHHLTVTIIVAAHVKHIRVAIVDPHRVLVHHATLPPLRLAAERAKRQQESDALPSSASNFEPSRNAWRSQ